MSFTVKAVFRIFVLRILKLLCQKCNETSDGYYRQCSHQICGAITAAVRNWNKAIHPSDVVDCAGFDNPTVD